MKKTLLSLALLIGAGLTAAHAQGINYNPPESGLVVLNLAGSPISYGFTTLNASFQASSTESTVTFVFRHDPGFFTFNNASVVDILAPSINLLTNGNFTSGRTTSGQGALGWNYFQQQGVTFLGRELAEGGWYDGATGGYDGISQSFETIIGNTYNISFDLSQTGANSSYYKSVSDNGNSGTSGNGINVVVYAGNAVPTSTSVDAGAIPEPSTYALFGLGAVGMLIALRRKKTA